MVTDEKIDKIRKQVRKSIDEQPMVMDAEPPQSGDPINTIQNDIEEKDEKGHK